MLFLSTFGKKLDWGS